MNIKIESIKNGFLIIDDDGTRLFLKDKAELIKSLILNNLNILRQVNPETNRYYDLSSKLELVSFTFADKDKEGMLHTFEANKLK